MLLDLDMLVAITPYPPDTSPAGAGLLLLVISQRTMSQPRFETLIGAYSCINTG